MPYAPGISFDFSPVSQGLAGGMAQLANALVARKEKQEQDKDFQARSRSTESFIKAHASDLGWNPDQVKEMLAQQLDETPRAKYLRLSDTVSQAVTGSTLKRQNEDAARKQQIEDLQIAELKRQVSQGATNRFALRNAFDPELAAAAKQMLNSRPGDDLTRPGAAIEDPLRAYTGLGGDDPHALSALVPLARQMLADKERGAQFTPSLIDLGGGLRAMTTSRGSAVPIDKPAAPGVGESQLGKLIRERDAFRAVGREDVAQEYDRVITNYGARDSVLADLAAQGIDLGKLGISGTASPGTLDAAARAHPEESTVVPKGTRVKQGAKTYEYDGSNWIEVKA